MSAETLNHLALVRSACRALRRNAPAVETGMGQIIDALDRMVAELGPIAGFRSAAAVGLGRLNGHPSHGDDYEAQSHLTAERLRGFSALDEATANELRSVLDVDGTYWQSSDTAIQAELAASQAVAPVADAAPAQPIDIDALGAFIRKNIPGEADTQVLGAKTASEGTSKKTIFARLSGNRTLPGEIVLRMDKAFNFLGTTVRDEYPALRLLHEHGAPVPKAFALEASGDVLGGPFILVERLTGTNTGKSYFPPPRNDRLTASIAQALARIHAVPVDSSTPIGAARTDKRPFVEFEYEKYHADWLATGAVCPTVDAAFAWIRANMASAHGRLSIVHNDYDYHNIIVDGDRVSGVVDWEFVHIGNPAADLGYFQDSADQTGGFEQFLGFYEDAGGKLPSKAELDFYIVWGHLRLAVMSFQVEMGCRQGKFDDIIYALAGVHFLRKPMLALVEHLTRILG